MLLITISSVTNIDIIEKYIFKLCSELEINNFREVYYNAIENNDSYIIINKNITSCKILSDEYLNAYKNSNKYSIILHQLLFELSLIDMIENSYIINVDETNINNFNSFLTYNNYYTNMDFFKNSKNFIFLLDVYKNEHILLHHKEIFILTNNIVYNKIFKNNIKEYTITDFIRLKKLNKICS